MRREAGEHENFFVAKIRDSESAPDAFHRHQCLAPTSRQHRSLNARLTKIPVAQAIPAILTFVCGGGWGPIFFFARRAVRGVSLCALCALPPPPPPLLSSGGGFVFS